VAETGEYHGEVKFLGHLYLAHLLPCMAFTQQHWLLLTRRSTLCAAGLSAIRMSLLTGQLSHGAMGVLAITLRIHKDENKIGMPRKTAFLRTLQGLLSSLPALGWNSGS